MVYKGLYGFAYDVAVSLVDAIPVFGSCRAGGRRLAGALAQLSESLPRALRWRPVVVRGAHLKSKAGASGGPTALGDPQPRASAAVCLLVAMSWIPRPTVALRNQTDLAESSRITPVVGCETCGLTPPARPGWLRPPA